MTANTTTNIKIFKKYLEASCLIEHSWKPLLFVVVVVVGFELGIENKTKQNTDRSHSDNQKLKNLVKDS